MNAKRLMKWMIVLVLLAALPVMTVALAQEAQPGKQLPAVTEPGESQAPETYNLYEVESNNTRALADSMGLRDVMGGKIGSNGDVDYFKFNMPDDPGYVLIDIEAYSIGSPLDPIVCLENSGGTTLACSDDTDTVDSLVYYGLYAGNYYIKVVDYDGIGGASYNYELILSSPLLVSASAANLGSATVAGIPFQAQDILAHSDLNTGAQKWVMFFDGSDVGITKNITNIATNGVDDEILFSLAANQTLPGVGVVKPWDIVVFDGDQYGPVTEGTFLWGMIGGTQELTTSGEKLDGIDNFANGYNRCYGYPMSTTGVATVLGPFGNMKQDDEDVFCLVFNGNFQNWDWFFDVNGANDAPASEPAPGTIAGMPAEDVFALAYNDTTDVMYLTILGGGKILNHAVNQKDIFAINYPNYTWNSYVWRGGQHGWNYNIDAIEYMGR